MSEARIDELFLILSKTPECFDKALPALWLPAFNKIVFYRLAVDKNRFSRPDLLYNSGASKDPVTPAYMTDLI